MNPNSTILIDLHKYLVCKNLIAPFNTDESYNQGSHLDQLREGNWFKNLSTEFTVSKELFLKICIDLYHLWETESIYKLYDVFENTYSYDKEFIKNYLEKTVICNELFIRASERLQSDYELLKLYAEFVYPEGEHASIIHLNDNIQKNRDLMLRLITDIPSIFPELNEEFRNDEEFVTIAIKYNGLFLEFVGEKIKDNKKLVALAINNNIKAVLFASKRLREFPDGVFYEQYWHVKNSINLK